MSFKKILITSLVALSSFGVTAGEYQDKLSECLVNKISAEENQNLTTWIYLAFSSHPAISKYSKVTDAEMQKIDKNMAVLFQDLFTTRCNAEIKAVTENEGTNALGKAFELLGNRAAENLMQNPAVEKRISSFAQYFDEEKMRQSMK
ncbi:hypothetical protein B9T33_12225 [Acinetobacter sp. ANC 5054]|uniref:hypothetical protein n=1 Tax=Acinetobacter sp. ANC 5054 TaxID=1977877 RepID=UPI000A358E76|nr:hypothetical protein [Acinetobacter sp. ANC 5054]OTG79546.1 hypothetical protein B9T33_12225 [Acinetobacter sp. ANC 5054]